jgi:hypothetical protein
VRWGARKAVKVFGKGYKLHGDGSDTGFPPDGRRNGNHCASGNTDGTRNVPFMDSAYDSKTIDEYSRSRDRIPISDPNKRKDNDPPALDPAKQEWYTLRTTVERANSHLKGSLIPRSYRGERLQGSILRFADCGHISGCSEIPPIIYLEVWERSTDRIYR